MNLRPATAIDRDSLKLLMERTPNCSRLKIEKQHRRLDKAYREGKLCIPVSETEDQKWWRCEARFMLGDYSNWDGWEYRDGWSATLWHWRDTRPYQVLPWNCLPTDCLYIIGEQGVGDVIFFASCIQDCLPLAKKIILECDERLRKVCERNFGIETVAANFIDEGRRRKKRPLPDGVTAWASLGDLPRMWRQSLDHFPGTPYLTADPEQVERFSAYRGRTGYSWRGGQGSVKELALQDGVSLQYDQAWDEDMQRPDLDLRDDIEGVLGLLANLDKVVTVSTSVAHFAAAMGKETHVIIADHATALRERIYNFPFKWVCRKTPGRTPWYNSARVYNSLKEYL